MQFELEEGETIRDARVQLDLSGQQAAGTLRATATHEVVPEGYDPETCGQDGPCAAPYQSERTVTLAYFPLESPCGGWNDYTGFWHYDAQLVFDADRTDGSSAAISAITEALSGTFPLSWSDGTKSDLSIQATDLGPGCLRVRCDYQCASSEQGGGNRTTVLTPMELDLSSDDGRIAHAFPGTGQTELDVAGELSGWSFDVSRRSIPPDELTTETGITGVSLDAPSFDFSLSVGLSNLDDPPTGSFTLTAPPDPGSSSNEPSSCSGDPCLSLPGEDRREVTSAVW
jgi:hypothetical protein